MEKFLPEHIHNYTLPELSKLVEGLSLLGERDDLVLSEVADAIVNMFPKFWVKRDSTDRLASVAIGFARLNFKYRRFSEGIADLLARSCRCVSNWGLCAFLYAFGDLPADATRKQRIFVDKLWKLWDKKKLTRGNIAAARFGYDAWVLEYTSG